MLFDQTTLHLNKFGSSKLFCLDGVYNKPKMCNLGVEEAQYENIVILDSDRILPPNYFNSQKLETKVLDINEEIFLIPPRVPSYKIKARIIHHKKPGPVFIID